MGEKADYLNLSIGISLIVFTTIMYLIELAYTSFEIECLWLIKIKTTNEK